MTWLDHPRGWWLFRHEREIEFIDRPGQTHHAYQIETRPHGIAGLERLARQRCEPWNRSSESTQDLLIADVCAAVVPVRVGELKDPLARFRGEQRWPQVEHRHRGMRAQIHYELVDSR